MHLLRSLALLCLPFLLLGCAHRAQTTSPDARCQQLIAQVEQAQNTGSGNLDKRVTLQIRNLITGAKIDFQQRQFIQCLDKSSRALKLLDNNAHTTPENAKPNKP
jgi:hypothetical protein